MKKTILLLLVLFMGCDQTAPVINSTQSSYEASLPASNPMGSGSIIRNTLTSDKIVKAQIQLVNAYNPVLLYALTQGYIENTGIKYGLFKIFITPSLPIDDLKLNVRVPDYSEWNTYEIEIPGAQYSGFHTVNFSESVLSVTNATPAMLEYYLTYNYSETPYQTSMYTANFTILGRSNYTWWYYPSWDDPQRILEAAWVNPTQPEIIELAETRMGLNNTGDYGAAYLLAMEVYNNLFRERIVYKANAITRQLPVEVLRNNEGDCDEMSGLYASVLEVLGIETKKVNIPGHQYMLIKLGDYWKGFDPTVRDYGGTRVMADFQFSMEVGEEEYKEVDENTTIFSHREEWARGLRKVIIP